MACGIFKNAEHLWKVGNILQKVGNMERKLGLVLFLLSDIKQALPHNSCIIITWHPTNKESSKQVTSIVSEGIKYLLTKPEMCRLIKLFSSKRCWGERGLREVAEEREGARVEQTRAGGARAGARVERSPTWAPTSPTDRRLAPGAQWGPRVPTEQQLIWSVIHLHCEPSNRNMESGQWGQIRCQVRVAQVTFGQKTILWIRDAKLVWKV